MRTEGGSLPLAILLGIFLASLTCAIAAPTHAAGPCSTSTGYGDLFTLSGDGGIYQKAASDSTAVAVFAPGSRGDIARSAVICGPHALIDRIRILGTAGRRLYVLGDGSITVFRLGANGNATPTRRIGAASPDNRTGLFNPIGAPISMSITPSGTIYVLDDKSVGTQADRSSPIYVFSPGSKGDLSPTKVLDPFSFRQKFRHWNDVAYQIVLDTHSRLYLTDQRNDPMMSGPNLHRPYLKIFHGTEGGVDFLALDGNGKLYVSDGALLHIVSNATSGASHFAELGGRRTGILRVAGPATDNANQLYKREASDGGDGVANTSTVSWECTGIGNSSPSQTPRRVRESNRYEIRPLTRSTKLAGRAA